MRLYHKVNNLLERYLNVRFMHVKKTPILPKTEMGGQNNLIVEFVGAQGTGKTTLYRYYLKNHERFKKKLCSNPELESFTKAAIDDKSITKYFKSIYDKLLIGRIKSHQRVYSSESLLRYIMIADFISILQNDIIVTNFIINKLVLLDRHIFKVFTKAPDLLPSSGNMTKRFMRNRVFIYCKLPPEILLQRIKKEQMKPERPN